MMFSMLGINHWVIRDGTRRWVKKTTVQVSKLSSVITCRVNAILSLSPAWREDEAICTLLIFFFFCIMATTSYCITKEVKVLVEEGLSAFKVQTQVVLMQGEWRL